MSYINTFLKTHVKNSRVEKKDIEHYIYYYNNRLRKSLIEEFYVKYWFFRYFGEKPFLGIEYFNAKKFKTSSSIHLTFNHFNSVDISLTNGISVWIN